MTDKVVESTSTEVALLKERLAQQLARQQEAANALRSTGAFISFKNANLKVDGQPIPGNMIEVRVLAAIGERTYYADEFDADAVQVPDCYSLDDTVPHIEARNPQSDSCGDCPQNKWGTALRGKGKACREGARVIVVPANVPLKTAPMFTAKIPVTSLNTVTAFTSRCSQAGKLSGEFVTQLSCVEDKKSFFKVHLTLKEVTNDMDMEQLLAKQDQAYELAMQPYPRLDE